jgi:hypothetical protein
MAINIHVWGSGTTCGVVSGSTGFSPASAYWARVSKTTAPLTGVTNCQRPAHSTASATRRSAVSRRM